MTGLQPCIHAYTAADGHVYDVCLRESYLIVLLSLVVGGLISGVFYLLARRNGVGKVERMWVRAVSDRLRLTTAVSGPGQR